MKKIFIIVSHSSGEFDTLLPLLYELKKKYEIKIKILVPVKKIYKQVINNLFILKTLEKLNIKLKFSQSFNKFDYPSDKKILKKIITQLKYILKNIDVFSYDYFFHETTNQKNSTLLFRIVKFFFNKKVFIYHHGQSLNQPSLKKKFNYDNNNVYLAFSSKNIKWAKDFGFNKIHVIFNAICEIIYFSSKCN